MESLLVKHIVIWGLLAAAIITALLSFRFSRLKSFSLILLLFTCLAALLCGQLSLPAALYSAAGLGLAYATPHFSPELKKLAWVFILLWCTALMLHSVPGFGNVLILNQVRTGPDSLPFTLYLNLDKPLVFFALWLACPGLLGAHHHVINPRTWLVLPALLALLPIAWAIGTLHPESSFPDWLWLFMLNNLLITCVVEEALFRGFLQPRLCKIFNVTGGIIAASLLFGLAHLAGGMILVLFASLAGLGYGLAFYFSQRLWVAIGFHFIFNLTHLLLFSYPAAS